MKAAFDHSAATYDADFTNTSIGRSQRNQVWKYLEQLYANNFPENVLELNCGTGEDAIFFAEHGSKVLATDISEKMLAVTKSKIQLTKLNSFIATQKLDLANFSSAEFSQTYDLIFSNFGGLNCLNAKTIERLLHDLKSVLNAKGRVILVIMPRFCAWESLYFGSRLRFGKAFRRRSKHPLKASLGTGQVDTWYYDPKTIQMLAGKYYQVKKILPIGISIPPSYLQQTFISKKRILNGLNILENGLNKYSSLAPLADHYLIDLELK